MIYFTISIAIEATVRCQCASEAAHHFQTDLFYPKTVNTYNPYGQALTSPQPSTRLYSTTVNQISCPF